MEKLSTQTDNSYWDGNGAYQEEYHKLYSELVPVSGEASTVNGEMIRCVSRLTYDFFNNGNCNVLDIETKTETYDCSTCNGSGEVEEDDEENEGETIEVPCGDCCGSGEVEEDSEEIESITITEYYQNLINFLDLHLKNKEPLKKLIEFLKDENKSYSRYEFNAQEKAIYNNLTDEVMYQILSNN